MAKAEKKTSKAEEKTTEKAAVKAAAKTVAKSAAKAAAKKTVAKAAVKAVEKSAAKTVAKTAAKAAKKAEANANQTPAVGDGYEFVHDLSIGILKERYESGIPTYTTGAYEAFFEEQAALHAELERLTPGSRKKMRNQVFRMMVECDLVSEQGDITPIHPSPDFARVIDVDHRDDLDLFPGVTLR